MKSYNSRIAIANDKITVYIHYHPLFDDPHSRAEEAHYNFAVLPSKTRKPQKDPTLNYHTVKALQIVRGSTKLSQKHHCSGVFGEFPSTHLITSELTVGNLKINLHENPPMWFERQIGMSTRLERDSASLIWRWSTKITAEHLLEP